MKQRIISGVVIAIITVIAAYFGGFFLKSVLTFVAVYGSYEFMHARKKEMNYVLLALMIISVLGLMYFHDYATFIILVEITILMTISVFDKNEKFDQVCPILLVSVMLGYSLYFMIYLQAENEFLLAYVLIMSYLTDVFAYFVGIRFGKHKLNERVSPKKTIEGSLGGLFFGFLTSFLWAKAFNYFGQPFYLILIASLLLPIVSEIGDLVFSLIKRHYGVKDFSNLIPGHGGILDRLDSHIFCIMLFGALLSLFK